LNSRAFSLEKRRQQVALKTNLEDVEAKGALKTLLSKNQNVMICCGRMGPMCIPVYGIMEGLRERYAHVAFRAMDYDGPASDAISSLPECASFMGLPMTIYYQKGEVVAATASIQTAEQVTAILDERFGPPAENN
jgi:thioredoxin